MRIRYVVLLLLMSVGVVHSSVPAKKQKSQVALLDVRGIDTASVDGASPTDVAQVSCSPSPLSVMREGTPSARQSPSVTPSPRLIAIYVGKVCPISDEFIDTNGQHFHQSVRDAKGLSKIIDAAIAQQACLKVAKSVAKKTGKSWRSCFSAQE